MAGFEIFLVFLYMGAVGIDLAALAWFGGWQTGFTALICDNRLLLHNHDIRFGLGRRAFGKCRCGQRERYDQDQQNIY